MPTTVRQLFNQFDIVNFNQVKWNTPFKETKAGVYIVSTSDNSDKHFGISNQPIFDDQQIKFWISKLLNFQIDGISASAENLRKRLTDFWLPDESILYIGKAPKRKKGSGLSKRVTEYFSTIIGNSGPHSGGQWIKTLKNINSFTVYYGACDECGEIENKMLQFFMNNISKETLLNLHDKQLPLPFANIKYLSSKKHGFKNQRL